MHGVDVHWRPALTLLLGWILHLGVAAQVSWSVDTTQIQWGEPLTLTADWMLSLESMQEGLANEEAWPNWTDTTSSGFEVLSSTPVDTLAAGLETGADVILRKSWVLTSWDSGFVVMAPERFGPHETTPLLVRVVTPLLEDNAQPKPPSDIAAVQWTFWEQLLMAGRGCSLAVSRCSPSCCEVALRRWNNRTVEEPLGKHPKHFSNLRTSQLCKRSRLKQGRLDPRTRQRGASGGISGLAHLPGRPIWSAGSRENDGRNCPNVAHFCGPATMA